MDLKNIYVYRYQTTQGKKFWQKDQNSSHNFKNQPYKARKPFKHKKPQGNS